MKQVSRRSTECYGNSPSGQYPGIEQSSPEELLVWCGDRIGATVLEISTRLRVPGAKRIRVTSGSYLKVRFGTSMVLHHDYFECNCFQAVMLRMFLVSLGQFSVINCAAIT